METRTWTSKQNVPYFLSPRVPVRRNPVRTEGFASLCITKATSSANVEQVSKARNVRQVGLERQRIVFSNKIFKAWAFPKTRPNRCCKEAGTWNKNFNSRSKTLVHKVSFCVKTGFHVACFDEFGDFRPQRRTAQNATSPASPPAVSLRSIRMTYRALTFSATKPRQEGAGLSSRKDSTAPSTSTETGPTTSEASVTWAASSGSGWTRSTDWQVRPTTNCELSWRTLKGTRLTQSTTRLLWQTMQTTTGWALQATQVTMKCGQVSSIQYATQRSFPQSIFGPSAGATSNPR